MMTRMGFLLLVLREFRKSNFFNLPIVNMRCKASSKAGLQSRRCPLTAVIFFKNDQCSYGKPVSNASFISLVDILCLGA